MKKLLLPLICALAVLPLRAKEFETIIPALPCEWQAEWIGGSCAQDKLTGLTVLPARYLRTEVNLPAKAIKATLNICGLGLYEAWINGRHITAAQVLSPTLADYDKSVYYNSFDVTAALRKGENAIAVELGGGRFTSMRKKGGEKLRIPAQKDFGTPRLICQLEIEYADGTSEVLCSNAGWKLSTDGPIRANSEFDGETYDARMEFPRWTLPGFDDSAWRSAEKVDAPKGELRPQPNPNIAIQDRITPVAIRKIDDYYVLDMGQNMVGWLQLKMRGLHSGDTVQLVFAETANEDGTIYLENLRQAKVTDTYIAGARSNVVWHPTFVYHGFRYVKVSGLRKAPRLKDFEGQVFYDKMTTTGRFACSNEVMNRVYKNCFWGIRGNYRGMPTDCPQRDERQGWFGDRTINCYGESYLFDNHALYSKWMQDIEESQLESGSLPNVAPAYWSTYGGDNMTWPGCFVTIADMLYERYGDPQPIRDHYAAMAKWMDYMWSFNQDGIIPKDQYGDWCMPPEDLKQIHSKDPARITGKAVLGTTFYYYLAGLMQKFALICGNEADNLKWGARRAEIRVSYNARFLNTEKGCYDNNTVTANALSLYFGLVPEEYRQKVFDNIIYKTEVEGGSHVSCGLVGMMVLQRCLSDYGRADLAYTLASNDTYPSWGYMATQGATTIWELWNGNTAAPSMNSMNHVMMIGDLLVWEYEYLAGIRPAEPGFTKVLFKPVPPKGLEWVDCSYDSIAGRICSAWTRKGDTFTWHIETPVPATVVLPDGSTPIEVPAGKYHYSVVVK